MDEYLKYLDEQTVGLSNIEKLRFAYIDLGLKFSFNINYIFETNLAKKYSMCENAGTYYNLTTCFLTEKILCKDTSLMMKIIGDHLGFKISVERYPLDRKYTDGHMYNIVINPDGSRWTLDLQKDIKYIRNYMKTRHFGRIYTNEDLEIYTFNQYEIELMDRKIGYLDDEHYNDYYYEQMRQDLSYINSLENKLSLILGNIEYKQYPIGDGERHFFHKYIMEKLLDYSDLEKINVLTCYRKEKKYKKYFPAVILKDDNDEVKCIYYYDLDKNTYKKISPEKFMRYFHDGKIVTNKSDISPIKKKVIKNKNRH